MSNPRWIERQENSGRVHLILDGDKELVRVEHWDGPQGRVDKSGFFMWCEEFNYRGVFLFTLSLETAKRNALNLIRQRLSHLTEFVAKLPRS